MLNTNIQNPINLGIKLRGDKKHTSLKITQKKYKNMRDSNKKNKKIK